jgi:hypothetical protein
VRPTGSTARREVTARPSDDRRTSQAHAIASNTGADVRTALPIARRGRRTSAGGAGRWLAQSPREASARYRVARATAARPERVWPRLRGNAPATVNREHGEALLQLRKLRRPARVAGRGAVDQNERRTLAASPHGDQRPVLKGKLPRVCAHRFIRGSSVSGAPLSAITAPPPAHVAMRWLGSSPVPVLGTWSDHPHRLGCYTHRLVHGLVRGAGVSSRAPFKGPWHCLDDCSPG